jgi:predicted nucleotide-binding protein (sugar kinase/HSP70/actin superfamily)
MIRILWSGLIAADIIRKLLLKTRPYEDNPGDADQAFEDGIDLLEADLARPGQSVSQRLGGLAGNLLKIRAQFRSIAAHYVPDRPLIGVVGEIFCRLNTFSNKDAVRRIEAHGGEAWLSDVSEWVWYTNWSQKDRLIHTGKRFSMEMVTALIRNAFQRRDEHRLISLFAEDFVGYEEPHAIYEEVLAPAWPYLPADGALGEMVLSVGKSLYLHRHGADGIIDISPFSCMNGIVTESVYHAVQHDCDDMPIRNFYFDATTSNMERDLDIFMELAVNYRQRKRIPRRYPACFPS